MRKKIRISLALLEASAHRFYTNAINLFLNIWNSIVSTLQHGGNNSRFKQLSMHGTQKKTPKRKCMKEKIMLMWKKSNGRNKYYSSSSSSSSSSWFCLIWIWVIFPLSIDALIPKVKREVITEISCSGAAMKHENIKLQSGAESAHSKCSTVLLNMHHANEQWMELLRPNERLLLHECYYWRLVECYFKNG